MTDLKILANDVYATISKHDLEGFLGYIADDVDRTRATTGARTRRARPGCASGSSWDRRVRSCRFVVRRVQRCCTGHSCTLASHESDPVFRTDAVRRRVGADRYGPPAARRACQRAQGAEPRAWQR